LNGYHVVFGELIEGDKVLKQIEEAGSKDGKPSGEIKIVDCGLVKH
jgi:peptidyl-prolyl isomerase G (cyclophilin G)